MAKFLVTDPCYIVPKEEWDKYVDSFYGGTTSSEISDSNNPSDYKIEGKGKIIAVDNTSYGDGEWIVGRDKTVQADAGMVCIVELEKNYTPTAYEGTAVTDSETIAREWFDFVISSDEHDIEAWYERV